MDRPEVERLLSAYVDALATAIDASTGGTARQEYLAHYDTARNVRTRWQGGEFEEHTKAAIEVELVGYRVSPPPGWQAEMVGGAFGVVCRALGVV
jgi:hypothetical protein